MPVPRRGNFFDPQLPALLADERRHANDIEAPGEIAELVEIHRPLPRAHQFEVRPGHQHHLEPRAPVAVEQRLRLRHLARVARVDEEEAFGQRNRVERIDPRTGGDENPADLIGDVLRRDVGGIDMEGAAQRNRADPLDRLGVLEAGTHPRRGLAVAAVDLSAGLSGFELRANAREQILFADRIHRTDRAEMLGARSRSGGERQRAGEDPRREGVRPRPALRTAHTPSR